MDVDAVNGGEAVDEHVTIQVKDPRKCARNYQVELCRRALEENVIVYLETGCGKTHIAILLMYEMGHLIRKPQKNICIFLAHTVALVNQQASVIEDLTDFKVGTFCGYDKCRSKHKYWERVLEQFEVLVMTPIILYRGLCHRYIKMEMIALLIFDECHYAQVESNHPYTAIMKEFYNNKVARLPRIFGMTASPILGRGGSVDGLEALLHAKVCSVEDKGELEMYVASPVIKVYYYLSSIEGSSKEIFIQKLKEIKQQSMEMLRGRTDDHSNLRRIKKLLHKLYNNMEFCLGALGISGVLQASDILLNGDQVDRKEFIGENDNSTDNDICDEFLSQITSSCSSYSKRDGAESALFSMEVLEEPFFSNKILRLIQILSNFRSRNDMKCIIFVNRKIVARSLCHILQRIKILSSWKCGYLLGIHCKARRMSRSTMNDILDRFRSGELNLLIATKVGEEGLDIQTCCLVIRFDLPETVASFIQSRGRARMLQSEYVLLVNGENEKEVNVIDKFKKEEDEMNVHIVSRKSSGMVSNFEVEQYRVDSTGASISLQSSATLLHHYCSKLPRDEYFNPHPQFFYINDVEGMICHIILPANAPMHQVVSTPQSSMEAAKKNACLKACQQLHEMGALTDYLLPDEESYKDECLSDMSDSDTDDDPSRGELHEMIVPALLKESWLGLDKPVSLNSYFISFTPEPLDREYKEFGFFLKAPLPSEAQRMELSLHLSHGRSVMTQLVPSGITQFNEEEILLAQKFQEMLLKIVLDRTEFVSNSVPLGRNINYDTRSSVFYLLLPVMHDQQGMMTADWKVIKKCLSSPIFNNSSEVADNQNAPGGSLKLVDGPLSVNNILNSLVYVDHKKSFFFVSDVLPEKNAYSPHNASYSCTEYLLKAHDIQLSYPDQPLLRVKQLFSLHNLLHDRKKGASEICELEEHFFELPPELCQMKILGFSKEIGSSISLLPSLMHRLENLLVAIELKNRLSASFPEGALVTAERVLEALTTEKCHERFSLERLEVLGDAFLKFAVGRHLFLRYDAIDEGQLTRRRSRIVNNSNLYKIAIKSKLQVYIRDEEFDPVQFFAFGRPCSNICTDESKQSIHPLPEPSSLNNGNVRPQKCSKSHHWLYKKTISDVVEALIGAYIVDSGFKAATAFLRWMGIEVDFEAAKVHHVGVTSSSFMPLSSRVDIPLLEENVLQHKFQHKGLLLQAFVHPSYNRHSGGCYQRLEFLGDAVLDYLITSYLYSGYPNLKPGQLTDLRSVLVNNSAFARIAINHGFHTNILCDSQNLREAIDKYVKYIDKLSSSNITTVEEPKCPKALGDLVESCFGAILLDTGFNLNLVWRKMLYFLSSVMKFTNLQVNPLRELTELCQYHKWDLLFNSERKNKCCTTEAKVEGQVNGKLFCRSAAATSSNGKSAKKVASQKLFKILKAEGYRVKSKSLEEILRDSPKGKSVLIGYDEDPVYSASPDSLEFGSAVGLENPTSSGSAVSPDALGFEYLRLNPSSSKRSLPASSNIKYRDTVKSSTSLPNEHKLKPCQIKPGQEIPKSKKSEGSLKRTAKSRLHEVCAGYCWLPPVYECFNEQGPSHLKQFTYKVVLEIDEAEVAVECQSEAHPKKKEAAEHAAEGALWFLRKEGYITDSESD